MKNNEYRQSAPGHGAVKQNYIGSSELKLRKTTIEDNEIKKGEKKEMRSETDPDNWRIVLHRLNDQLNFFDRLPKESFEDDNVSLPSPHFSQGYFCPESLH